MGSSFSSNCCDLKAVNQDTVGSSVTCQTEQSQLCFSNSNNYLFFADSLSESICLKQSVRYLPIILPSS